MKYLLLLTQLLILLLNFGKTKILSITNLATTAALTTVENEIPNVSDLVKQSDCDGKISEMENKYLHKFT